MIDKIISTSFNGIFLEVSSKKLRDAAGVPDIINQRLTASGGIFCTAVINEEAFTKALKEIDLDGKVTNKEVMILADHDIVSCLTEDELHAILMHEVGHVVNKHLAKVEEVNENGIGDYDWMEVQADNYAISTGASKKDLLSAIVKLICVSKCGKLSWWRKIFALGLIKINNPLRFKNLTAK